MTHEYPAVLNYNSNLRGVIKTNGSLLSCGDDLHCVASKEGEAAIPVSPVPKALKHSQEVHSNC